MEIKVKLDKWDLSKLKSFFTVKETLNKTKRKSSEWEKIIANKAMNKELISKIHKQLMKINIRKTNNATHEDQYQKNNQIKKKKWPEDLNKHFSKEDTQEQTILKLVRNHNRT